MPPKYTPNLNLAKPEQDDQYNIDIFNANTDKIDAFAGLIPPRAITADKLTTGANINGVKFDGVYDVVTGWGWYYSTVNYPENSIVYTVIGNEVKVKRSLRNDNKGHSLSDVNWWADVELGGSGGSTIGYEDVGTIKFSLTPLRNENLHKLDGSTITQIPVDFSDYIVWLRSNAPNCFVTAEEYNSDLALYGECGHFVYDSSYNTIRLPKVTGIIQGTNTLNALGQIIQAGLPGHSHLAQTTDDVMNIDLSHSHTFTGDAIYGSASVGGVRGKNGVLSMSSKGDLFDRSDSGGWGQEGTLSFNATPTGIISDYSGTVTKRHSHSIEFQGTNYESENVNISDTVQPQTIQGFYYMVYTNLGVTQDSFIQIISNKADKSYVDNQMAIADQTYATKAEVLAIPKWTYKIVESLPSVGQERIVYLVQRTGSQYDTHDEYIWITETQTFEYLGSTQVDLSNYYTKQQVYNTAEIDAKLLEIETGEADIIGQISGIINDKLDFSTGLNVNSSLHTSVSVSCTNEDLDVESSYQGTQSSEGTIKYEFIYDGENWTLNQQVVDLDVFDLSVSGEANINDKITLIYTTLQKDTITTSFDGDYDNLTNKPALSSVALTGAYADLIGQPTIPTVNNGTITIKQGGTNKGSFTVNQSGDTTIELDSGGSQITVDQVFDKTSANPQSGVAINGAGFLKNTASGSNSLTVGNATACTYSGCINIGNNSTASANNSSALGYQTQASGQNSIAIGTNAVATAASSIQIGHGTNSEVNSLSIGFSSTQTNYQLLDGGTGLIPDARISYNIARRADLPTVSYDSSTQTLTIG